MEYEGISVDVVTSGIRGGTCGSRGWTTGATSAAAGTGAGAAGAAAGFLDFFFFLVPFLPMPAKPPPAQQQHRARRRIHCQICSWEPQEPLAVEPELAELEES